jgi:GNAT superfamily N-acetyltransferase
MNFRPFNYSDADYQTWADIANAVHPDYPQSIEQAKLFDRTRAKEDVVGSFIVEEDEKAIGWVHYETPRNPVPETLAIFLELLPEYYKHMNYLWDFLQEQLQSTKPKALMTVVTETWFEYQFYKSKGFTVYDSMWASKLDVTTFEPQPFELYLEKTKQAGIQIKTLADFPHHEDSFRRNWYALIIELLQSVPSADPVVPWTYETWLARTPVNPNLLPEGYFFALDNDEIIGISELWKNHRPKTLQTGLTAVRVSHRRKGIAQTLKVKAAMFAKDYGVQFVRTNNHQINHPMLSINEAMGFVKEPARLFLKKELS